MGRLAQKLKGGLRTALKIGAVGAGLAGAYLATKSAKKGKDALETGISTGISNAQVLGQEAVSGGQAVVSAGVVGGQSEAKKQAERLGVLTNLGLEGENLSEIRKAQQEQRDAPTLPPVNPNLLRDKGRSSGIAPLGDDDVAQAVRMANCSQKYGGSGIRYRRCLKTGK